MGACYINFTVDAKVQNETRIIILNTVRNTSQRVLKFGLSNV